MLVLSYALHGLQPRAAQAENRAVVARAVGLEAGKLLDLLKRDEARAGEGGVDLQRGDGGRVAAVGADSTALLDDLKFTGFLFESLVIHDLRVYAQANDARVYHYRDSSELEVDAIVQKRNGDWCAIEVKLGIGQFDEAAANLLKLVSVLDSRKVKPPKSLAIITGTGISHLRADGISVISIAALGA